MGTFSFRMSSAAGIGGGAAAAGGGIGGGGGAAALAALGELSPAQQLRLRAFHEAVFAPDVVGSLIDGMLPPQLLEDEREAVCAALATSLKCFLVQVAEEAVAVRREQQEPREAREDEARGAGALLQPAHLLEAYRRLGLRGRVLGAPAATVQGGGGGGSGGGGSGGGVGGIGGGGGAAQLSSGVAR